MIGLNQSATNQPTRASGQREWLGKEFHTNHWRSYYSRISKSLLFNTGDPWVKRNNESMFDVTMGTFDGAEICDVVGLFILNMPSARFGWWWIRDDGVALVKGRSARNADKARKAIYALFDDLGLKKNASVDKRYKNGTFPFTESQTTNPSMSTAAPITHRRSSSIYAHPSTNLSRSYQLIKHLSIPQRQHTSKHLSAVMSRYNLQPVFKPASCQLRLNAAIGIQTSFGLTLHIVRNKCRS